MLRKSFTIVELMIVVIIIGVLSTYATPTFRKMKERSYDKDVKVALRTLHARNKAYKMSQGMLLYDVNHCATTAQCERDLDIELDNDGIWDYKIECSGAGTCAKEIYVGTRSGDDRRVYCIDTAVSTDVQKETANECDSFAAP